MEHPLIFSLRTPDGRRTHKDVLKKFSSLKRVDTYDNQLSELYLVRHPTLRFDEKRGEAEAREFVRTRIAECSSEEQGSWVFFPWNNALIHLLSRDEFYELRTARNRNLITEEEQARIRKAMIGVAGLSVGNSVALALALEGYERFRITDGDVLSLSNLNRVRAGVEHLGMRKTEIVARQIYELHPYADVEIFDGGLSDSVSVKRFAEGVSVAVDEMDDSAMKIELRRVARGLGIPVVSAADNGDGAILHVERFDREPARPLFHGRVPDFSSSALAALTNEERIGIIAQMVGEECVVPRMKESVSEVGKTLYAWPQLGGAAFVSGGAVAWAVNGIMRGDIRSGMYDVNFDRVFAGDGSAG